MKQDKDFELISSEIGYFVKPRTSPRKAIAEAIIGALVIVAFVALLIWITG
jgi:hypothetical protein